MLAGEAGQLLAEAQIEAVDEGVEAAGALDGLAAGAVQLGVGGHDLPELGLLGGAAGKDHLARARALGDVHQVVAGDAVAVQVVEVGPAVGNALAAFVEQADGRLVAADQRLRPGDGRADAVADQVGRIGGHLFIGVEDGPVAVVGAGRRRRERAHLGGRGAGVGRLPAQLGHGLLAQAQGQLVAAALLGVGDLQHVVVGRIAQRPRRHRPGTADTAGGRRAAGRPAVTVVAVGVVVHRPAIGPGAGGRAQVQLLVIDGAVGAGVDPLGAGLQAEPGQLAVEGQVQLPHRRLLDVGRQEVDIGLRRGTAQAGGGLQRRIGLEQAVGGRAGAQRAAAAAHGAQHHAGVGVRVAQPHRRRLALEQADAAAQLALAAVGRVQRPVEADARLPQAGAVQRLGVVDAEAAGLAGAGAQPGDGARHHRCGRGGIGQRRVAAAALVQAQAQRDGELLVDRPGVLQEQAGVGQRPVGGGFFHLAAGGRGGVGVAQRAAAPEVLQYRRVHLGRGGRGAVDVAEIVGEGGRAVDAAEHVVALGVLHEGVEHVVAADVDAALDLVRAQVPGAGEVGVLGVGGQLVEVAAGLGAQEQRRIARASAGAGRPQAGEGERHLRHAQRRGGHAFIVALGQLQLGAEAGRPVGEPLAHHRGDGLVLRVPEAVVGQRGGANAGELRLALLGLVVAQAGAVVVGDGPVQLQQRVLDHQLHALGHGVAAHVHAIGLAGDGGGAVDGALVDQHVGAAVAHRPEAGRAARAAQLFVVGKEEQLVLQDRPAQGEALGVFLEHRRVEVDAGGVVQPPAHQALVAEDVVHAALELVGAALGHRVDVGAGVALLGDVVVADVDLGRLDGVDRDRLLQRGQVVVFQAEGVVGGDAVDGDRVVAEVLAAGRDAAALLVGLAHARVGAGVVLQVALDRRQGIELRAADAGARAHVAAAEGGVQRLAGDDHGGVAQRGVQRQRLGQGQHHALAGVGLAALADGDGVGPAHSEAAGRIAAVAVGGGRADRPRRRVQDGDGGAGHGLAAGVGHPAADRGGGVLRHHGRRHDDRDGGAQGMAGKAGPGVVAHRLVLLGVAFVWIRDGDGISKLPANGWRPRTRLFPDHQVSL